jgi:hypothetical protein
VNWSRREGSDLTFCGFTSVVCLQAILELLREHEMRASILSLQGACQQKQNG